MTPLVQRRERSRTLALSDMPPSPRLACRRSYPRRDDDLATEEAEVKNAALALLSNVPPPGLIGVPEKEVRDKGRAGKGSA